jgi:hypothetical protein
MWLGCPFFVVFRLKIHHRSINFYFPLKMHTFVDNCVIYRQTKILVCELMAIFFVGYTLAHSWRGHLLESKIFLTVG